MNEKRKEAGAPATAWSLAASSLKLGLQDGLRPRLAFLSTGVAVTAFCFWLVVLLTLHAEAWRLAGSVVRWVSPAWLASAWLTGAVTFLLVVCGFIGLVMLSVQVFLELFFMARIQRQCLKRYPELPTNVKGSLSADLMSTLTGILALGAGLLLLLIPLLGAVLFLMLAGYLNVRGLVNDALDGVATVAERQAILRSHRTAMLLVGVSVPVLAVIPLLALVVPSVLGASVCHLCLQALQRQRRDLPLQEQAPG